MHNRYMSILIYIMSYGFKKVINSIKNQELNYYYYYYYCRIFISFVRSI